MLSSYFDYIFVHLRQKARLRPELSPKFCQLEARTRPEKPGSTYNSATMRLLTLYHAVINSLLTLYGTFFRSLVVMNIF